jgi:hypothetical protein
VYKEKGILPFEVPTLGSRLMQQLASSVLYPLVRNLMKRRGDLWDLKFVVSSSKEIGKILKILTSMRVPISNNRKIHVVP